VGARRRSCRGADSDDVAGVYRFEVVQGFRDDLAHLSDLISPRGRGVLAGRSCGIGQAAWSIWNRGLNRFFLLLLLWACGKRSCVVQAKWHVHSAACLSSGLTGAPQALACEVDPVIVVDEAVEYGVGVGGIADQRMPLVDRELAAAATPPSPADVAEPRPCRPSRRGAAADAVDQRFAAAIEVVELRLGHAVINVDGRPQQHALLLRLIEPVRAGRCARVGGPHLRPNLGQCRLSS
jgi:hypothetical protein